MIFYLIKLQKAELEIKKLKDELIKCKEEKAKCDKIKENLLSFHNLKI